mgnify:CR=1 FL=1
MRILVIGGLGKRGMQFIETLAQEDWLVILDNIVTKEAARNLMKLLMRRKFKLYRMDKRSLTKIKDEERIDKIYDFST